MTRRALLISRLTPAGGALLFGLALGVLLGALGQSSQSEGRSAAWTATELPQSVQTSELVEALSQSRFWEQALENMAGEAEEEPDSGGNPERPGVFRYLYLVAILQNPAPEAVLRLDKLPESMSEVMVSLPRETGLMHVSEGEMIASGWVVQQISPAAGVIQGQESGETVTYRLFEW